MKKLLLAGLIVMAALTSCLKNSTAATSSSSCTYDPCAYVAPPNEIDSVKKYLGADTATYTRHCSGVYYKIDNQGTGVTPNACSTITVQYVTSIADSANKVIDKSTSNVTFALSNLVRAWVNVVPLIKAGGVIHIYAPPSMAYGTQTVKDANGNTIIAPNSVLKFDVTLIGVQ